MNVASVVSSRMETSKIPTRIFFYIISMYMYMYKQLPLHVDISNKILSISSLYIYCKVSSAPICIGNLISYRQPDIISYQWCSSIFFLAIYYFTSNSICTNFMILRYCANRIPAIPSSETNSLSKTTYGTHPHQCGWPHHLDDMEKWCADFMGM